MDKLNHLIKNIAANEKSHFWIFLIVLVLLSFYLMEVFGPVYEHPGYDYYFHLKRFEALITALKEGNYPFYIDYAAALNYGYLSRVFYSDIVLVPFAAIGILIGSYEAYELMLSTMTLLCGSFMFFAVKTITKSSFAAFVSGILYTFSVYRFYDIYNRGALGEVFAFTFIPLIFLGLYHIIKGDYKKWYIITIGFSLLIFSHVISTVLTFITVVIILLCYTKALWKEPKRIGYLALAGVVAIAITALYIFPMLEQMQDNHYRYESNDWTLPANAKMPLDYVFWGLVCGFYYPKDISMVGIGILLTVVIFLRLFVKEKTNTLRAIDISLLIGLFYIFASSRLFPWGRFPFTLLSFIQYPSRLYLLVTLFFAAAGGYYLSRIFRREKERFVVSLVIIICTATVIFMHNENFRHLHVAIHTTNKTPEPGNFFYLNGAEYVPEKVESAYFILSRGDTVVSLNQGTEITQIDRDHRYLNLTVNVLEPDSLELPLFYYKGYHAELNGETLATTQSRDGLLQIPVHKSGDVQVFYQGTMVQKVSYYFSVIAIFSLCIYIFMARRKKSSKT